LVADGSDDVACVEGAGLLVEFIAGFVFCLIVLNDQIGGVVTFVAAVAGGLVTFLGGRRPR
jgi:hypothetical protein